MANKYKCEEHYIDIACIWCFMAINNKYLRLLEFVEKVRDDNICEYVSNEANDLLKEIGDDKDE